MPSHIELQKNDSLPSSSGEDKIVFGINELGEIIFKDYTGDTLNLNVDLSELQDNMDSLSGEFYQYVSGNTYTYQGIMDLIDTNSLTPSSQYRITDADPELYGGTEIVLTAASTNSFNKKGVGKFYNPKYDKEVDGYGIWSNKGMLDTTNLDGDFEFKEEIIGDGGQVGYLSGTLWGGYNIFFEVESGDWSSVTGVTGDSSSSTAEITNVTLPTYTSGSTVIYGGKVWVNLDGTVGNNNVDMPVANAFELNTESWSAVTYNDVDYNVVWDEIEFDITNNFILSRREIDSNNYVEQTFENLLSYGNNFDSNRYYRSIKAFQWGNGYNYDLDKGIGSNHISESFVEVINFNGKVFSQNEMINFTTFGEGSFDYGVNIYQNKMNSVWFWDNYFGGLGGKYLRNNNMVNSSMSFNSLSNYGSIQNCSLVDSGFYSNGLMGSYVEDIQLFNSYFDSNVLRYSSINNNSLKDSDMNDNELSGSNMDGNVLMSSSMNSNLLVYNSNMNYNNLINDTSINGNEIRNDSYVSYNSLVGSSYINDNVVLSESSINNNELVTGYLHDNVLEDACNINENKISLNSSIHDNTGSTQCSIIKNEISSDSSVRENNLASGSTITNNIIKSEGEIHNNTMVNGATIESNDFKTWGKLYGNNLSGSTISYNSISDSEIYDCNLQTNSHIDENTLSSYGYIYNNNLTGSSIFENTLTTDSGISDNLLSLSDVSYNSLLVDSVINNNNLINSNVNYNTSSSTSQIVYNDLLNSNLSRCRLEYSTLNFQLSGQLDGVNITKISVKDSNVESNISSATTIFGDFSKTIFQREGGDVRLMYYDDTDTLVITDVNA
jgi:hypothetical protein